MADEADRDISRRFAVAALLLLSGSLLAAVGWQMAAAGWAAGEDSSSHLAEIAQVADLLRAGETDFWFDQTNLGYPMFLAYHPGPALVMGGLVALLAPLVPAANVFKASIALLWAAIPLATYLGGRWLGLNRTAALAFALLGVLVVDWRDFGLGLRSTFVTGLYTQLFGQALLPLAVGALWRHLHDGGRLRRAALLLCAAMLGHAFFGMYAIIAGGVMLAVTPSRLRERWRRLAAAVAVAVALAGFWIVPMLVNREYQGGLPWRSGSEDGYPVTTLVRHALGGAFLDADRFPWLTILVVAGVASAFRHLRDELPRFGLALFGLSLVLMMGRTTFGGVYDWIPFHDEFEVIRYLSGVQWCGLLLAALAIGRVLPRGLEALSRVRAAARLPAWMSRTLPIAVLAVLGTGLAASHALATARVQQPEPDFMELTDQLAAGSGRFLCHRDVRTATHPCLNLAPLLAGRPQAASYARGYHDSLSLYYLHEADFRPSLLRLYGIRTVVSRGPTLAPARDLLRESWRNRSYQLYEVAEPYGYFEFVRTPFAIEGNLTDIRAATQGITSGLFEAGMLPLLGSGAPPVGVDQLREALAEHSAQPIASRVVGEATAPNRYRARVQAAGGDERLLVKASYHPYWDAFVDGREVRVHHAAPNLMVIDVPAGEHEVELRYRNPLYQKLLLLLALVAIGAWFTPATWRARLRRSGGTRPTSPGTARPGA